MSQTKLISGIFILLISSWLLVLYFVLKPVVKAEILAKKGDLAFEKADFGDAEVYYKNAIENHPESGKALGYNIGNSLYRQGRIKEAIPVFQKQLQQQSKPLDHKAWFNLGNAYFMSGDTLKSLEAFSQALLLDKEDLKTRQNLLFVLNTLKPKTEPKTEKKLKDQEEKNVGKEEEARKNNQGEETGKPGEEKQDQKVALSDKNIDDLLNQIKKNEDAVRGKINNTKKANPKPAPGERDY